MSLRATSPPPRATTPEPTLQPLPSPRLRPSRSIRQLKPLTTIDLSSQEEFHLTFDEFGTDHRPSKTPTSHSRPRRKSGPTPPSLHNPIHHHKSPRRSGSPPPPAHHHPTPPPPLPPLPSFLISAARKSSNCYGFDIPDILTFPSTPSSPSDESVNSRCYSIHRSN
ncbi:hypothetical protein BDM02DRAFT_3125804 [Thelephora ganbajun]|uniref:Uncharacterized protein n=1 Tax=Thelephora ganbajun TaxID=370292 RepID=A0ACB6ZV18_THEGA|nr:hypothetical protein BDM02DRAFT_3125804 [Thelephora ganbajun]